MTQPLPAPETSPPLMLDGVVDPRAAPAPVDSRWRRLGRGDSLRALAARGTLINTAFMVALSALGLLKGFVLAAFVSRADYGVWGILVVSLGTLLWMKQVSIGDKFIQQDENDQELAFQKAFTLELAFTGLFVVLVVAAIPVMVLVYGAPELVLPGFVVAAILLVSAFQAPLWVYYRRMQFVRQRTLQAIDPVVGFIVSIALAVAGTGYWAFIGGIGAGVCASAAMAVLYSPFRLRFRYEPRTLRSYASFSWPLFVAGASSVVIAQSAVIAANSHLGIAAIGVVTLAATITGFTDRVDQLVTGTLYPAICAVKDNAALLYESFVKSNRLALMWAVPFGVGVTLFCSDVVTFGIGHRWKPAVDVLQIYGLAAALNHVGFNWTAYFRARAETRPIATASFAAMGAFLIVGIPLIFVAGLRGFAIGIAIQGIVHVAFRAYYLQRLFHGFAFVRHAMRAFAPTLPAAAAVIALRAIEPGTRTLELAFGELVVYLLVTVLATWYLESTLLREAASYVVAGRAAKAIE